MRLAGKKALVTGAARGIGRGCAVELARAGADVAINDLERTPAAEAVLEEIRALGREAVLVEGDAFDPRQQRAVATVPADDPAQNKTVAARHRKGFRAGDRVIRPEIVSVYAVKK